ncbi:MAG TPA: SBBP repeat-containing protein, partial [Candidatus Kapabacteria bacterium]|nr:SBBP repeat-containing protein [Candidatus Kapabacteria bacterium]
GGNGNDIGRSIAIDTDNNIYMTGRTTSTSAIATTGSHQTTHGGQEDAFLVKFNGSGVRQWGTYYGGTGNDNGSGIAIDLNGLIYVTGATASTTSIAVTGSHQPFFSFGFDAFLVKFNSSGVR